MKQWILIFGFALSFSFLQGQTRYHYKQFTIEDGVPTNAIYDITEGRDGKMYIGTDNGLSVYDGVSFQNYNTNDGIYNPYILSVYEAKKNDLYFASYRGKINRLVNGKISQLNFNFVKGDDIFLDSNLMIIRNVNRGSNYKKLGTYQSFNYEFFDLKKSSFLYYKIIEIENKATKLRDTNYKSCQFPPYFHYQNKTIKVIQNHFYLDILRVDLPVNLPIIYHIEVGKDKVYLFAESTFIISNFQGKILTTIALDFNITDNMNRLYTMIDKQDRLWINIQLKGLYILEGDKFVLQNDKINLSNDESINKIYCDSRGRIWICTFNQGLFLIENHNLLHYYNPENENRFNSIISSVDNKIYASSRFSLFELVEDKLKKIATTPYEFSLNRINHKTFVTGSLGLYPYMYRFPFAINVPNKKALEYKNELYGYGFSNILAKSLPFNQRKEYWYKDYKITRKIHKILVYHDSLLCALDKDIVVAAIQDSFFSAHRKFHLNRQIQIKDMEFYGDKLVVAESDQINFFENEKLVSTLNSINHVKLESIYKLKADKDKLWIFANNGLFLYRNQGNSLVLNRYNYLPSSSANDVMETEHFLYIATDNGIGKLDKEVLERKSITPKISIDKFETDSLYLLSEKFCKIPSSSNSIKLFLNCISSMDVHNLLIEYKLDNENWEKTNLHDIILNSLSYGNHTLSLRAKDINSDWTYYELEIFKQFPIYLRWWFILLSLLFIGGGIYAYFQRKLYKKESEKNREMAISNQIIELRQSALSAMMNPHFIFNSLNAIQYFINSNQKEKSSEYLAKLSRLVRLFLNHASEPLITLHDEIDRLKKYVELEQLRFYAFQFHITIGDNIAPESIQIPNMILQPFIENAILHGISHLENKDGEIHLYFQLKSNSLLISIIDNGYGIDKSTYKESSHISKALSIIQERISILQKQNPNKKYSIEYNTPYPDLKRKGHEVIIELSI